jgi:hypothetical protein
MARDVLQRQLLDGALHRTRAASARDQRAVAVQLDTSLLLGLTPWCVGDPHSTQLQFTSLHTTACTTCLSVKLHGSHV